MKSSLDKAAVYLADCRSAGIRVLPPDINRSVNDFAALRPDQVPPGVDLPLGSPGAIAFGLSAVRNVGEGLVEQLLAERAENGPYASFHEFVERVPEPVLNKRTVESLIKAGAFDTLGHPRLGLVSVHEQIIDSTVARRRERDQGVLSLFGDWAGDSDTGGEVFDERVEIPESEYPKAERLRTEKEMLGLYVSDHPLLGVESALRRKVEHSVADLGELDDGTPVVVGGIITNSARKFTKKGEQMAVFVLEDLDASVEVTVFPRTLVDIGHQLVDDRIVAVRARLDRRDETRVGLIAQDITVLTGLDEGPAPVLRLRLPGGVPDRQSLLRLRTIIEDHPGDSAIELEVERRRVLRLGDAFRVDLDTAVGELRVAFGHEAVLL